MTYVPKTWLDGSVGGTPITAAELNRIETGIQKIDLKFRTVEDYGVVGDGTTDDTTNFQAAIDADVPLLLSPGKTYLCGPLNLRMGTTLYGLQQGGYTQTGNGQPVFTAGLRSTIKAKANISGSLFSAGINVGHVRMHGFEIDGNLANQSVERNLINLTDTFGSPREAQWRFHDMYLHDVKGSFIYVGGDRLNVAFYDTVFYNSSGSTATPALNIHGDDFNMHGCLIGSTTGNEGLALYGSVFRISSTELFNIGLTSVHIGGSRGTIYGCTIGKSQQHGVYFDTNTISNDISGTVFHSNSLTGNGSYDHIAMSTGVTATLNGCKFEGPDPAIGTTNKPNWCVNQNTDSVVAINGALKTSNASVQTDISNRPSSRYTLTQTTAPSAGGAGALPATPAGYEKVIINGTARVIPYY